MLGARLENVRKRAPLIHNITNYVTVNDCANILLGCGASPIMADDIGEAADIASLCAAVNINIGTLNVNTIPSMFAAGKMANALGRPVLLDPVGAGASALRTGTALALMKDIRFTAIRGNGSEIRALASGSGTTKGVDADVADAVTEANLAAAVDFVKSFARDLGAAVAMTGAIDIVADAETAYVIRNGHPMMSRLTGAGCMLSAVAAACLAANPDSPLEALAAAVCALGLAGERAFNRLAPGDGNMAYRNYLIDEMYHMDGAVLDLGAKYAIK